jgi:arsenate reductase
MAEGLLRHFYNQTYDVYSAGTNPTQIHPLAVKVMAEIGIDISGQRSKGVEQFTDLDIDLAISVCQSSPKIACALCSSPMIGGRPEWVLAKLPKAKRYVVHGFSDPSEVEGSEDEKLQAFRRIRDEIKKWILEYFKK